MTQGEALRIAQDQQMSARPLSPAERAMRIAWKVQLSEDTRQRKLAMRSDATQRKAAAVAKRMRKVEQRQAEARRA